MYKFINDCVGTLPSILCDHSFEENFIALTSFDRITKTEVVGVFSTCANS